MIWKPFWMGSVETGIAQRSLKYKVAILLVHHCVYHKPDKQSLQASRIDHLHKW